MLIEEYVAAKTEERECVAALAAGPRTQHEADCGTTVSRSTKPPGWGRAARGRPAHQASAGTPTCALQGQLVAVWHHRLRRAEVRSIQSGQFPIVVSPRGGAPGGRRAALRANRRGARPWQPPQRSARHAPLPVRLKCEALCGPPGRLQVLHGSDDIIARPRYGLRLARRLQAPCIVLEGGHFVFREQAAAVNHLLRCGTGAGPGVVVAYVVWGWPRYPPPWPWNSGSCGVGSRGPGPGPGWVI